MNTIDTRDLYKRKCELEDLRDAVEAARDELTEAGIPAGTMRSEIPDDLKPLIEALDAAIEAFGDDEQDELTALESVESEMDARTFRDGEMLIPEQDFEDYARELADDLASDGTDRWPFTCIDWKQAADELKMDYSSVEYEGTTYYFRA